ncbi:glycerophosphoryl diester phosphodiesterase [Okibacterium fritillariae]|uniref:Glycerophosphoryl diester phosphodiesterase n=1 Tax=Okibacterium fritillariae TaxID=123320 RepID=A0A1T5JKZ5_9MICO|nr:glycerophosphoryl diester phosphodiesterase [Okibacterium fritillariae]
MQRPRVVSRYLDAAGPRVFAHRGFADGVPGNTLAAFRAALDAGATHLESDVRATRDGIPVLFHDECLPVGDASDGAGRSIPAMPETGALFSGRAIRSLTLAEVRRVDLGGGHRIPTVAEALDAFPDALWNLDLKAPDAVVATAKQVWRAGAADRVLLTSFSEASRVRAVRLLPGIATSASSIGTAVLLLAASTGRPALVRAVTRLLPGTVLALQIPERAGPLPLVTSPLLTTLHGAGLEVHVWTVNERADIRRLLTLGVDGIVTDRPDVARAVVDVLDVFEALGPPHTGS